MTLLEAAKNAHEWLCWLAGPREGLPTRNASAIRDELRTAIAAEEATIKDSLTVDHIEDSLEMVGDGTHSCGYFCTRPACVLAQRDELTVTLAKTNTRLIAALKDRNEAQAERDALRAKLAQMESAEPVAYSLDDGRYRWLSHSLPVKGSEEEKAQWIPLYTHPAPAYVPMTDEELEKAEKWAFKRFVAEAGGLEFVEVEKWETVSRRAIANAVLARLGVGS